jgi:hypothetical protein
LEATMFEPWSQVKMEPKVLQCLECPYKTEQMEAAVAWSLRQKHHNGSDRRLHHLLTYVSIPISKSRNTLPENKTSPNIGGPCPKSWATYKVMKAPTVLQCLQCTFKTLRLEEVNAREMLKIHNCEAHPPAAYKPVPVHEADSQIANTEKHNQTVFPSSAACNNSKKSPSMANIERDPQPVYLSSPACPSSIVTGKARKRKKALRHHPALPLEQDSRQKNLQQELSSIPPSTGTITNRPLLHTPDRQREAAGCPQHHRRGQLRTAVHQGSTRGEQDQDLCGGSHQAGHQ